MNISLNDSEILQVQSNDGEIILTYLDWQEEEKKIRFDNPIYMELQYAGLNYKVKSGDFIIKDNDKKINEICSKFEEEETGYKLFTIMCPWDENKLVEIIAKKVELLTF